MRTFIGRVRRSAATVVALVSVGAGMPGISPATELLAQNARGVPRTSHPSPPLTPNPALFGRWETVIPDSNGAAIGRILGMQTVHAVLLPSGKVLWASGSSWRNHAPVQHYPQVPNPPPGTGVFDTAGNPFATDSLERYYQLVNNVAIYDPARNTFFRIPHPVPVPDPDSAGQFAPSDLFCTGHLHLRDGNVLFTGGTQYYYPFRTGNRTTYIFDWRKELAIDWARFDWRRIPDEAHDPWIFSGFMPRGRWYASVLPLLDGRMAVFSGFVGFDRGYPPMYQFEINHTVDFFDPSRFDRRNPQAAWRNVDVQHLPNSPFATVINPAFKPDSGDTCDSLCMYAFRRDAFKLYPENYLMPDGRIYLTREGDWVSLRTPSTAYMRRTTHTYWATIGGTADRPTMAFQRGPERPDTISSYGTTYLDPNTGRITLLGGQPTSPGTLLPMNMTAVNDHAPTHFAGGLGSRKREEFHPSPTHPFGGRWTMEENFLGSTPQDDRTMHYAIVLPTRQVLVINGGNYDFYGPVFYPLLLTPRFAGGRFTGYDKRRMSEGVEPRLYHNNALLLPDGRILISGGNSARATVRSGVDTTAMPARGQPKPNLDMVDVDMYFFGDGPMGRGQKGQLTTPTEDWVAEIFSPPYLFIDRNRRAAVTSVTPVVAPTGYQPQATIGGQTLYLFHSNTEYRARLTGLPTTCAAGTRASLVLIKLSSATHGWQNGQHFYQLPFTTVSPGEIAFRTPDARAANLPPAYYMMFYVDCRGKPAVARMVRFDDQARAP